MHIKGVRAGNKKSWIFRLINWLPGPKVVTIVWCGKDSIGMEHEPDSFMYSSKAGMIVVHKYAEMITNHKSRFDKSLVMFRDSLSPEQRNIYDTLYEGLALPHK